MKERYPVTMRQLIIVSFPFIPVAAAWAHSFSKRPASFRQDYERKLLPYFSCLEEPWPVGKECRPDLRFAHAHKTEKTEENWAHEEANWRR